ncbi:MAG TPA: Fe-S-containing hydro-lyase [Dehalococcoidia bacterium]|nr:Fe-S-containing hydro-lyase [Dehalococcoidia bacterium]
MIKREDNKLIVTPPLSDDDVAQLRAGDHLRITGVIYTARDAAHKRIIAALQKGEAPPFDLKGQIIYYVGPTPPKPGRVIGSAGPTTSIRMDPYFPPLLAAGLKATIGKGGRGPAVREALKQHRGLYLLAIGGAGALLSQRIKKAEVVAYEDLGTEAVRRLEVEEFPVIVCDDIYGGDLLEQGKERYRQPEKLGSYRPVA